MPAYAGIFLCLPPLFVSFFFLREKNIPGPTSDAIFIVPKTGVVSISVFLKKTEKKQSKIRITISERIAQATGFCALLPENFAHTTPDKNIHITDAGLIKASGSDVFVSINDSMIQDSIIVASPETVPKKALFAVFPAVFFD